MKRALRVTWLRVNTAPFEIAASFDSRMYPESWKSAVMSATSARSAPRRGPSAGLLS